MSKDKLDVESIRKDFPILKEKMNGKPLVYLDSAATSQKPIQVIDAISDYYKRYNANIHRGIYKIAERATLEYAESKAKLANLINSESPDQIIYTRNTTEAINLVAFTWADSNIGKKDHILISEMEHHSNIVPWQELARKKGAVLDYIKMDGDVKHIDMADLEKKLEKEPKLVAVTHVSNVIGTISDVKQITKKAHERGAVVLVDGAQSAPHMRVDVKNIGCDFFALSGHKMLGPTGTGALYGRRELLESMPPFLTGGDMIRSVTYESATWNDLPWKFEAGTPNIEGGIALGIAIDYLNRIGLGRIRDHEKEITKYALDSLNDVRGISAYGPGADELEKRGGVVSFSLDGVHPHDLSQILDSEGIAIRAGHHCAMPLVTERLKLPALSRLSFYLYNNTEEVDKAVEAIAKAQKIFGV
jgi:cysteine desulfurase/selenocysteine lyase